MLNLGKLGPNFALKCIILAIVLDMDYEAQTRRRTGSDGP